MSDPNPTSDELSEEEITEKTRPEQPNSQLQTPLGYSCPFCDRWLRDASVKRALNAKKKKDPQLVEIVLIRLRRQGWAG